MCNQKSFHSSPLQFSREFVLAESVVHVRVCIVKPEMPRQLEFRIELTKNKAIEPGAQLAKICPRYEPGARRDLLSLNDLRRNEENQFLRLCVDYSVAEQVAEH